MNNKSNGKSRISALTAFIVVIIAVLCSLIGLLVIHYKSAINPQRITAVMDFEGIAATNYTSGQIVGMWQVTTNQVSVVTDPSTANGGNKFLALANGIISTNLPTIPWKTYKLLLAYRGPGLVHWWRGETNAASVAVDTIGANNGILYNTAFTNGEVGNGYYFNGDAYIAVPYSPSLEFTNGFTIEMWYEDLGSPIPPGYGLISNRHHDPEPANLCINVVNNNGDEGVGVVYHDPTDPPYPETGSDDPNFLEVSRYHAIPSTHVFHHLAATLQQINSDQIQILTYLDGQLVRTKVMPGNFVNTLNTEELTIGATGPVRSSYGEQLVGIMDEVSMYNRCLSDAEVQAIYQDSTNGKFDPVEYTISPQMSLAKAQVLVNGKTKAIFFGNNTNWQTEAITFTANSFSTHIAIAGLAPGMLLDTMK
jgi:Concanavalin A-like lectin/glucanases superfamily